MATRTVEHRINEFSPYLRPLTVFNLLFAAQLFAAVVYGVVFEVPVTSFRRFLIPFIWITISVMAVWYTKPASPDTKYRLLGVTISAGYFLLILFLSGVIGPQPTSVESVPGSSGVGVEWWTSLGWGPVVVYSGEWVSAAFVPYQLIGYLALAYLIYAAVLDITKSATAGIIGLVTCPACAAPIFAPLLAGAAGASSAFALLLAYTYEIGTIFFAGAVALLYWRPTAETLSTSLSYNRHRIAGGLAFIIAVIHFFHPERGYPRLAVILTLDNPLNQLLYDPRPVLFVVSGLAIIAGALLVVWGFPRKPIYALGMALMATYLIGFFAWHLTSHGGFLPGREPLYHGLSPIENVIAHLRDYPIARVSKLIETILFALLAFLYYREANVDALR